jgi:hypothetical protein
MADEPDQPQDLDKAVDNAFEILLCNATEEIGFAPLDAYNFIFYPDLGETNHVNSLDYQTLNSIMGEFTGNYSLPESSSCVVAMYPRPPPPIGIKGVEYWKMELKSIRIKAKAAERMRITDDAQLRRMYNRFYKIPAASWMAGFLFESLIHRMFIRGWKLEGDAPKPIRMNSTGGDPPVFSSVPPLHQGDELCHA